MTYDLHIHSCLSPCADDDMTPANIAGFAKLNGIDVIAVADHNSALNLPAAEAACKAYGVKLLPAIETCTEEGIHLLTYFKTVDKALEMGRLIWESLPHTPCDPEIWGKQLVLDEEDVIIDEVGRLLTFPAGINIYEMTRLCAQLGGIAVPAHVDKDSTSLLSVLGFAPEDLPFAAYEVRRPEHALKPLIDAGRMPNGQEVLTSSDAHTLSAISEYPRKISPSSCLWQIL